MFDINGITWYINFVSSHHPALMRSDGGYAIGVCDNSNNHIYINENLMGALFEKVLCHELTHAAIFSYSINLTIEQEEVIADIIATYGEEIIDITNTFFDKLKKRAV